MLVAGAEYPQMMDKLKQRLVSKGKRVMVLSSNSFDSTPLDLEVAVPGYWQNKLIADLKTTFPVGLSHRLVLVGHSLGSNSCIHAATSKELKSILDIAAVVGINTPFTLQPFKLDPFNWTETWIKRWSANLYTENDLARFFPLWFTKLALRWVFKSGIFPTKELYLERIESTEEKKAATAILEEFVYSWWPTEAIAAYLHERASLLRASKMISDRLYLIEAESDVLSQPAPPSVTQSCREVIPYSGTHFLPQEIAPELADELLAIEAKL